MQLISDVTFFTLAVAIDAALVERLARRLVIAVKAQESLRHLSTARSLPIEPLNRVVEFFAVISGAKVSLCFALILTSDETRQPNYQCTDRGDGPHHLC